MACDCFISWLSLPIVIVVVVVDVVVGIFGEDKK